MKPFEETVKISSSFRDFLPDYFSIAFIKNIKQQYVKFTFLEQNKLLPCNMNVRLNCKRLLINIYSLYKPFSNSVKQSGRSCKRGPNYTLQSHASFTGTVINLNSALLFHTHLSLDSANRYTQPNVPYRVNTASRP